MDTTHPPDLSCDYIEHNVTKKPGTIYGGSRTFLSDKHCCNRYSLPPFASTTGHLGLYRSKKNWWRHDKNRLTDLNVKSLHPTPTAKKKFSQQGTLYIYQRFPENQTSFVIFYPRPSHYTKNTIIIKSKSKIFFILRILKTFSATHQKLSTIRKKSVMWSYFIAYILFYIDYLYMFVKYTSNRLVFVLFRCTGSVWKTDGHYVETEAWF